MSPSITIETAAYHDAEPIAQIQIAGWRVAYQGIIPESHLNNLSASDKTAFWQNILIDLAKAEDILVARRDDNNLSGDAGPQILGFVSFGGADDSPGTTEASKQGELRAIYVDPQHLSKGIGRCLWTAAQMRLVEEGYSEVVVWVFAGNEQAIRFYHRAGFCESQNGQTVVGGATVATLQLIKTI